LHVLDVLADDLEGVEQGRARDDRRPVLVIVEDRDLHRGPERFLDVEALGGLDVLEVDAAHGGLEELAELDDVLGILGTDLDVEDVDVGELLEEVPLAFHHRLAGEGADVAEAEDRGAVGHDRDQIALGGVLVGVVRVGLDLQAGFGDPRGVGQREVALIGQRLGGDDRDLARSAAGMVVECVLAFHGVNLVAPAG
jgi:hypothetical protein